MRVTQKENVVLNVDSRENSVGETLTHFGFLTPEKKRSRSANSPARRNISHSPRLKRTPITDHFSSNERPIYLPNQDEHNFLCEILSTFEHNSIYPRRIYRFAFEQLEASLWQPMKAEFHHCINALILGNTPPSLPDFMTIHETKAKITALFAGRFKSHANYFKNQVLALQSRLTPAIFNFNLSFTEESDFTIAKAYLAKLKSIPTKIGQVVFLQIEGNLEQLLLTANRNDALTDFCLEPCVKPFWSKLVAHLHPEIIQFLMNYLTTAATIENIHPFHFISALYDLHRDLSMMSGQLEKIVACKLADYLPENSREALLVLRSPFGLYNDKKTEELNSIRLLRIIGDTKEFNEMHELDFQKPEISGTPFLNGIKQKTFSQHMRTLFRNYTRLINDHYDFATLHAFGGAQQYVFDKVTRLSGIDNSPPVNAYKQALTTLDQISFTLSNFRTSFTAQLENLKTFMLYFIENKIHNLVIAHELRYQPEDQCYLLWLSRVLDSIAQNRTCDELDVTEKQTFADTLHQYNTAIFQIYESIETFRTQIVQKMTEFNQIQCEDKFIPQLIQTGFQLLSAQMSKYEQKASHIEEDTGAICKSINAAGMSMTNQSPKLF